MGESTKIQWCDHTFNPWLGCSKVHSGCTNCYAEHALPVAMRPGGKLTWGEVWQGGERQVRAESAWKEPLTWARKAAREGVRRRVFCASLADVLEVPEYPPLQHLTTERRERVNDARKALDGARARLWDVIRQTAFVCSNERAGACRRPVEAMDAGECADCGGKAGGLDWLLLTKRPEHWALVPEDVRPLVWLGTSVSDQETVDAMVPRLLQARGFRYRFLSVEPLVGRVDLTQIQLPAEYNLSRSTPAHINALVTDDDEHFYNHHARIDWVIVGGESGSKARPCGVSWVRRIIGQCREAGVPCFVKQFGARAGWPTTVSGPPWVPWPLKDPKGGDMAEWPEDLRVREVPTP